jgi:hypothetical protein
VHVGKSPFVELNNLDLTIGVVLLLNFLFVLDLLKLKMAQQIEVFLLGLASGWKNKVINGNLADLLNGNDLGVIQLHIQVEEGLVTTLGSTVAGSVVEFHFHDLG